MILIVRHYRKFHVSNEMATTLHYVACMDEVDEVIDGYDLAFSDYALVMPDSTKVAWGW